MVTEPATQTPDWLTGPDALRSFVEKSLSALESRGAAWGTNPSIPARPVVGWEENGAWGFKSKDADLTWEFYRASWPQDSWERWWYELRVSPDWKMFFVFHGGGSHDRTFFSSGAAVIQFDVLNAFSIDEEGKLGGPQDRAGAARGLLRWLESVVGRHRPNINAYT